MDRLGMCYPSSNSETSRPTSFRGTRLAKSRPVLLLRWLQHRGTIGLFVLTAAFVAEPTLGWSETAQSLPAPGVMVPTTPEPTGIANSPTLYPPAVIPDAPALPAISDATNPAALDYVIQYPLFGDLPIRKELLQRGIDFIAHYISETAS